MYKICSFDVGIKNLAYCIISKSDNKFTIEKWGIINLVSDKDYKCGSLMDKKNIICNKKASLCGTDIDGKVHYYCGTHKSKYVPFKSNWDTTFVTPIDEIEIKNKHPCGFILSKKQIECGKASHYISDTTYYCNKHKKEIIDKIKKDTSLKKIKKTKCTNSNIQDLSYTMYTKLDEIKELLDINEVFIENQPSLKNPTMKTISSLLFGYFVLRGNIDTKNKVQVKFISPSNKLKADSDKIEDIIKKITKEDKIYSIIGKLIEKYSDKDKIGDNLDEYTYLIIKYLIDKKGTINLVSKMDKIDEESKEVLNNLFNKVEKDDKNYDITKLLSIKYTEVLLKDQLTWLNHLNGYKKKDDMCDSFLQGYYILFSK